MIKQFLKLTGFFVAALLLWSGCQKSSPIVGNNEGLREITLGVSTPAVTRLVQPGQPDVLNIERPEDGFLFLVGDDGEIHGTFTLMPNVANHDLDNYELSINRLFTTNEVTFRDIDAIVTRVVVVANLEENGLDTAIAALLPLNGENISEVVELTLALYDLPSDLTHSMVEHPFLFADVPLTRNGLEMSPYNINRPLYNANVVLRPIFALIEIGGIGASKVTMVDNVEIEIVNFELGGIWINNYHRLGQLNSVPYAASHVFNANSGDFIAHYIGGTYISSVVHDWFGTPNPNPALPGNGKVAGSGLTVSPAAGYMWSYKVFAPCVTEDDGVTPSIVIRLNNVAHRVYGSAAAPTNTGVRYVTINQFLKADSTEPFPDNVIELFAGRMYRIEQLTFNFDDLRTTPNDPILPFSSAMGAMARVSIQ